MVDLDRGGGPAGRCPRPASRGGGRPRRRRLLRRRLDRGLVRDGDRIVPVLLAPDGTPLDLGRTRYTFPDRIRAAILARDTVCTKCGRAGGWLQIHHLDTYSSGGATSERNGVAVCPPCHRRIHRHDWRGELHGTSVVWHPPDRGPAHPPPPPETRRDRPRQQLAPTHPTRANMTAANMTAALMTAAPMTAALMTAAHEGTGQRLVR